MTKILVIEDTSEILNNLLDFLEAEDFEAIGAENGIEGVVQARSHELDLIICDIMMPELDGYEVLSQLREDPKTANIPFIFLTAKSDRSDLRQGMNLGADDYLTKPFTKAELLEAIEARLRRSSQQVEQLRQVSEQLDRLENFDTLTGLPKLEALEGKEGILDRVIARTDATNRMVPFLLLGLDKFGRINDTIGYGNGDIILQKVAQRLLEFIEVFDVGGVARISGDEFGIILPPMSDRDSAVSLAEELLRDISKPVEIGRKSIPLTGTIGISFYPTAPNLDELRRQAGVAMGEAKREGGNRCQIYTRPMFGFDAAKELQLAADIRQAWERNQLQVFYQPRVDLRKRKIVAVATVPHWNHPRVGEISPVKIISLATEAGLLTEMSEWMLRVAVGQVKNWQASRLRLRVAVSLSEALFNDVNIQRIVVDALQRSGIDSQYLEVEIPAETIANAKNANQMASKLIAFKQLGIQTTISQFGIGQSAIEYLGELALDNLKLDRTLVSNASQNAPLINAIVKMAQGLKLRAIADGVETEEQANILKKQKCNEIQQQASVSEAEIRRMFGKR
ncbi:EAL domain-containing response regulator [Phormidium sp. CCY1219]|uniref:EAL domain-containing response regulator n=1 Tax=Phormidium sp. CCY1219 TaxID=2886104 RepID=UPI002D1E95BE|nr:EAL domain-containing protein [Phormidium sp. CCY1219]MEB3826379.1 EAL domain-containing protein [Phormidium sp. CCY1219]